jgi:two-component system sensor histidine kinase QseC
MITAAGNYYLNRNDIERHSDIELVKSGFLLTALLTQDVRYLTTIQSRIDNIHQNAATFFAHKHRHYFPLMSDQFQFQIWDRENKLLLRSHNAPLVPFASNNETGLLTKQFGNTSWRIFTSYDPNLGMRIEVAEKMDVRDQLEENIRQDNIYIMLITYSIAGLLIWFIIGKGLESIRKVAYEVSHRAPTYLQSVDVTHVPDEIKPLVIELNHLLTRIQEGMEREKRFAGDAAHELRTPLAALKTQAQVALQATDETDKKNHLRNIISSVDRCTHIAQQLLTLSRLDSQGGALTDVIHLNLTKLVAEIVAQIAPLAIEKNIEIELVTANDSIFIYGNLTAISILIRNLVDNAIRYTPAEGKVHILIEQINQHVVLKVQDTGPGIPAELRQRVFERFFRVLGSKAPGSGLGLSIVQQIAQLHNAQVVLGSNENGKGLEVKVIFPKA